MTSEEQTEEFNDLSKQDLANKVNHAENRKTPKPKTIINVLLAILFGTITSIIVSFIWIGIVNFCNREFFIILIIGAIAVELVVNKFLEGITLGSIIGGILCICSYLFYLYLMTNMGYSYTEDKTLTLAFNTFFIGAMGAIIPIESKIKQKRINRIDNY
jgi:hypothetical protein